MRGPLFHFRKVIPAVGIYMLDYFILVYYYFAPFLALYLIYIYIHYYVLYIIIFISMYLCIFGVAIRKHIKRLHICGADGIFE